MKKLCLMLVTAVATAQLSYGQWTTSGSNIYYNSGNVGIGTTSPSAPLEIAKSVDPYNVTTLQAWNWVSSGTGWGLHLDEYHTGAAIDHRLVQNTGGGSSTVLAFHMGNVGIGTVSPGYLFDVVGQSNAVLRIYDTFGSPASASNPQILLSGGPPVGASTPTNYAKIDAVGTNWNDTDGILRFWTAVSGNTLTERMRLDGVGNVGIGTTTPDQKLTVNGTTHSKAVIVDLSIFPDYVFKPSYVLPALKAVKNYISLNHHLPDMPSEQEVIKNGLNLGEMNALLTKKVEELTLYLIEKDRQFTDQHKAIQSQREEITKLKKQLSAITKALNKN